MSDRESIYGRHPVCEALRAGRRRFHRLMLAKGAEEQGPLAEAIRLAEERGLAIERVSRSALDQHASNHQGIVALVDPYPYSALEDILALAAAAGEPPFILVLDLLQDPQNLGTLLRTAEAVGIHGVIMPRQRGVGVTPAVVSSCSGASEHLRIAQANLAQAITRLKGAGCWIAGLEGGEESVRIDLIDLSGALALVVGSEGAGLRRLVREACDFLVRIPMRGRIESLNASVAGSIALYEAWKAREFRGDLLAGHGGDRAH